MLPAEMSPGESTLKPPAGVAPAAATPQPTSFSFVRRSGARGVPAQIVSAIVHVGVIVALFFGGRSVARTERRAPVRMTFLGARPAAPPPPPAGRPRTTPRTRPVRAKLVAPKVIAPEPPAEEQPPATEEPEEEEGGGEPGGVEGGVVGGVAGGVVGGTFGGVVGGEVTPVYWRTGMTPPERVAGVGLEPDYTREAKAANQEGEVVARLTIDPRGEVTEVEILSSTVSAMNATVRSTLRTWRFRPIIFHDHPISIYVIQRLSFRLDR